MKIEQVMLKVSNNHFLNQLVIWLFYLSYIVAAMLISYNLVFTDSDKINIAAVIASFIILGSATISSTLLNFGTKEKNKKIVEASKKILYSLIIFILGILFTVFANFTYNLNETVKIPEITNIITAAINNITGELVKNIIFTIITYIIFIIGLFWIIFSSWLSANSILKVKKEIELDWINNLKKENKKLE